MISLFLVPNQLQRETGYFFGTNRMQYGKVGWSSSVVVCFRYRLDQPEPRVCGWMAGETTSGGGAVAATQLWPPKLLENTAIGSLNHVLVTLIKLIT